LRGSVHPSDLGSLNQYCRTGFMGLDWELCKSILSTGGFLAWAIG